MKKKKSSELENYEKDYLTRLNSKEKTKTVKQKKPLAKKNRKKEPKKSADTKTKKSADTKTKKPRKSNKSSEYEDDDTGIVLIEDDLEIDEQMQLEERKAYLEEARSQESSE